MTEALITLARVYIEDETVPYIVSDEIILQKLNTERTYVEDLQIYSEDYYYDNVSTVYKLGHKFIMNLVLTDGDGVTISSSDYTVDVENGIVNFDASPVVIPSVVYAEFTYHNFYDSVAEMWMYQAAKARISGRAKLGDEDIPMGRESREYCLMKYWDNKQSKSFNLER